MTHSVIIIHSSSAKVDEAGKPELETEISFSPAHDLSPTQIAMRVSKILAMVRKMEEGD